MRQLLVCLALLASVGCGLPPASAPATKPGVPAPRVYSREEFKALVVGKTEAEVIAAVGRPDRSHDGGGEPFWSYWQRTKDPATGKTDNSILLFFKEGRVDRVVF